MGLLNKLRVAHDRQAATPSTGGDKHATGTPVGDRSGPAYVLGVRLSNGLKEFLWHLNGIGNGSLLDLGPVWQTTVSFFIERGFKVYTEDLLGAWKEFLRVEEDRLRDVAPVMDATQKTPAARSARFQINTLQYSADTFDAVLASDLV